jgi:hypothetical protein
MKGIAVAIAVLSLAGAAEAQIGRSLDECEQNYGYGKVFLIRVLRTNIQKCVVALSSEHRCNHAFYRRPFVDVCSRFVCRNGHDNGRGLSVRNNEEGAEEPD